MCTRIWKIEISSGYYPLACGYHSCKINGWIALPQWMCGTWRSNLSLPSIAPLIFSVHCTIYILWKTSNCTRQHCLLNTSSRFQQLYNVDHLQSGLSRVWANFAELQKGCKIVLARRSAPYLRVVTNDKYCTSCHSSCKRSPKPDQRLYSTTARVCLSLLQTYFIFVIFFK